MNLIFQTWFFKNQAQIDRAWSFLIFFFPCVNWTNGAQNRGESISNVFFLMSKIDNCHFFWGSTITNKNKSTISNIIFCGSLQRRKSVIIFYSFAWNSYLKTDGASQHILFSIRLPTNNSWKFLLTIKSRTVACLG